MELTSHRDDHSRVHTLNYLDSLYQNHIEKNPALSRTSCLLSICSQAAEHGWEKHTTTLSGLKWALTLLENLSTFLVKSLPCHQNNYFTLFSNIKQPQFTYSPLLPEKVEAITRELHLHTAKSTSIPASLSIYSPWIPDYLSLNWFSSASPILSFLLTLISPILKTKQTKKILYSHASTSAIAPRLQSKISQKSCLYYLSISSHPFLLELTSPLQNILVKVPSEFHLAKSVSQFSDLILVHIVAAFDIMIVFLCETPYSLDFGHPSLLFSLTSLATYSYSPLLVLLKQRVLYGYVLGPFFFSIYTYYLGDNNQTHSLKYDLCSQDPAATSSPCFILMRETIYSVFLLRNLIGIINIICPKTTMNFTQNSLFFIFSSYKIDTPLNLVA